MAALRFVNMSTRTSCFHYSTLRRKIAAKDDPTILFPNTSVLTSRLCALFDFLILISTSSHLQLTYSFSSLWIMGSQRSEKAFQAHTKALLKTKRNNKSWNKGAKERWKSVRLTLDSSQNTVACDHWSPTVIESEFCAPEWIVPDHYSFCLNFCTRTRCDLWKPTITTMTTQFLRERKFRKW